MRVIVPLAAGGTGDTLARVVSEEMSKILGQPFVVENRPGSGGVIGTEAVAKSAPDGYTLLSASPSHVIHPALRPNVGYDPVKDFRADHGHRKHPSVDRRPSFGPGLERQGVGGLREAQSRQAQLRIGGHPGSATHLNMEMFKSMTGTFIVHIPYRGSTQSRDKTWSRARSTLSVDGLLPTLPPHPGRQAQGLRTHQQPALVRGARHSDPR